MENNNANDFNAGNPGGGSPGYSDPGTQGANPTSDQGDPGNQSGQSSDPRDTKIADYEKQLKALNKQLIDARRNGTAPQNRGNNNQDPNAEPDFNDPKTQYGMAMKMASADLRSGLERVLDLYPELPAESVNAIRRNPWAYAQESSFLSLNAENALLDIEEKIADYVDSLGSQNNPPAPNDKTGNVPTPAAINPNAAAEPEGDPGQNDWNIPLDELEKKANKVKANLAK